MATILPLSPTVTTIFKKFLDKLSDEKVLGPEALNALRDCLEQEKLDPESLQKAVLTTVEPPK